MKLTAEDLYELKVIDKIIEEPVDVDEDSFKRIAGKLKKEIIELTNEMKTKTIKALMVEPGKKPCECTLVNELRELQKAVSIGADNVGLIEILDLEEDVCLLCNEEGKLIGLQPNRRFGQDILCGVFYVVGQNKNGDLCSLDDAALAKYAQYFMVPDTFTDGEVAETIITRFFCCGG